MKHATHAPASSPVVGHGVWDSMSAVICWVRSCINLKKCKNTNVCIDTHMHTPTHTKWSRPKDRRTDRHMARPPNEQEQNTSSQFSLKVNWLSWEKGKKRKKEAERMTEGKARK